jgi:hypothetical protein
MEDNSLSLIDYAGNTACSRRRVDKVTIRIELPHGKVRMRGLTFWVTEDPGVLVGLGRGVCKEMGVFVPPEEMGKQLDARGVVSFNSPLSSKRPLSLSLREVMSPINM